MKKLILSLILLLFPVFCFAVEDVTLAWDSNTESDMAGYRVFQSPNSGSYLDTWVKEVPHIWDIDTQTVTLKDVSDGEKFWVVTAYNSEGLESGHSNEVSTTIEETTPPIEEPPGNPTGLRFPVQDNLVHSTFEEGDDGWGGAIGGTGYEMDNVAVYAGQYSMRVFATEEGSFLSIDIKPENWVLGEYPFVRFAYKIPNGVPVGLFFHTSEGWICLGGTSTHSDGSYPTNHMYTLIDDDTWHVITVNAKDTIREVYPTVNSVSEFEWFTYGNAQEGNEFWFDEFRIW